MKITIAQLNNTVGDIDRNIAKAKEIIASEESKSSDVFYEYGGTWKAKKRK